MPFGLFKRKDTKEKTEKSLERSRSTFFGRLTDLLRRGQSGEDIWDEAEELMIGADVGVATAMGLLERAREQLQGDKGGETDVLATLKGEVLTTLQAAAGDDTAEDETTPKPMVILVVGVNGAGKTTTIAKLANLYRDEGKSVVLAAADTFRAAAIEQLQLWGERAGAEVIAHKHGGDPAAVAFDALQAAQARGVDVVIVDTAGRLHTKGNLMEEMKKIGRVLARVDETAPHEVLLVLDATTGQNGLAQAREFTNVIGCTGIVLTKLDGTSKGGVVLAIAEQLNLPVRFIGTGEGMEDLAPFDPQEYVDALFGVDAQAASG
ncbi:MAG: signal recognition particle-docking protein FtsY [SAR202 cluster bacterium]|nr:signal recognition particle-docking protein FtsY [SAR202 cluster bacterium]|tara:strand:+ start:574 stop:1536 length:963 start_codon:yes stop_codon:yes gene_type:complete